MLLSNYFVQESQALAAVHISYDMTVVIFSVLVAIVSSYVTLHIIRSLALVRNAAQIRRGVGIASLMLGTGIFTMHYIGMEAVVLSAASYSYNVLLLVFSYILAVAGSYLVLSQALRFRDRYAQAMLAAIVMGLAVSAMHYVGMFGLVVPLGLRFEPALWVASVLLGIVVSMAAFFILLRMMSADASQAEQWKFVAAGLMGLAIASMHYLGMEAAVFYTGGSCGEGLAGPALDHESADIVLLVLLLSVGPVAMAYWLHISQAIAGAALQDVSNVLAHEQAQRQSLEQYSDVVFSSMDEPLFVLDGSGHIMQANKAAITLLGYSMDAMQGMPFANIVGREARQGIFSTNQLSVIKDHLMARYHRDHDGFYRLLEHASYATLLVDSNGLIVSANPIAQDLFGYTASELAGQPVHVLVPNACRGGHEGQRQHFMQEGQRATIAMSERPGLQGQRQDGSVFDAEVGLLRLELDRRTYVLTLVHDVAVPAICSIAMQYTELGKLFVEEEEEVITRAGEHIPASITASPLRNHGRQTGGAVVLVHDRRIYLGLLADKQSAEAQLLDEQHRRLEALGLMTGSVAHDFNNLLVPIIGYAEDLDKHCQCRSGAKEVLQAARQAAALCQKMLSYAGSGRLSMQTVNLASLIEQAQGVLSASVKPHVKLHFHLDKGVAAADLDVSNIEQVLLNLVVNASDAIHPSVHGEVAITTFNMNVDSDYLQQSHVYADYQVQTGDYVALRVQDNGSGMSEAVLAKIFDPFFTTKFTGRGIGMAAVYGIVKTHAGMLHVESKEGVGTIFTVAFPVAQHKEGQMDAQDDTQDDTDVALVDITGMRVLLIDDDELVRAVMSMRLTDLHCEYVEAENGTVGLEYYQAHQDDVDVIVLDMTMPVMSGAECFAKLKAFNPKVKIIMSSGYAAEDIHSQLDAEHTSARPDAYLPKPYDMGDLRKALACCAA